MIVPIVNIVKETGSDREVLPVSFGKPRFFPVGENAVDRHAGQIDDVADEFVADQKRNDVLAFVKGKAVRREQHPQKKLHAGFSAEGEIGRHSFDMTFLLADELLTFREKQLRVTQVLGEKVAAFDDPHV